MNNNFENLMTSKINIQQQLSEFAGLFDGLDNPAISENVTNLEVKKTELSAKISELSSEIESAKAEISSISEKVLKCSGGATKQLVSAICNQRLFLVKNKEKILFDAMTGVILPNTHYFDDIPKQYDANMPTSTFDNEIKKYKNFEIQGYNFNYPNIANFKFYQLTLRPYSAKNLKNQTTNLIISDTSKSRNNDYIENIFKDGVFAGDYALDSGQCLAFPFCAKFVSNDLLPDNNVFTPQERAQKVLNLFIQEGWIPKFDDEEITKLYEKMYITRPALIKQLAEINEKLAELPSPKLGFADGIDFNELIKEYDLAAIRSSHIQYYAESIRWFDSLLTNLDTFIHEHADLLAEAQTLNNRLTVAHHDDEYPVLTERAEYLACHLDFGVETMQSELIAFKNEVVAGRDTLAHARNLTALREIEKLERPDFYLVAEHTASMVKRQLASVDWFRENKELAATLIDLHEAWRDEFHLFEHTTRDHFMQKCKDESIDVELADGWFAEWRKERLLLEEHLLPLMKAGIEKVVPVEVVISAVNVLKTGIRDQLEKFFKEERVELYNEPECRQTNGALLERLKRDNRLAHINFEFQKSLEDLIFSVETTEGRLLLVEWAKEWYDTPITSVLVYIEKNTLQEESAQLILDEFRTMKVRNFKTFLADARSYAEARRKIENKWNSLMRRMEDDLKKKKNGNKQKKE